MSSTALTVPAASAGGRVARVAGLVVATIVVNVVAALGLVAAFDLSDDFEALQPGAIGGSTAIGMLVGVGLLALLRKVWPATADRRYTIAVVVGGLLSMAGPASLASNDGTVAGWSAGAVWALVPLHIIPTLAALVIPRVAPSAHG